MNFKINDTMPIVWTIKGRTYPPVQATWLKTHTINGEDVFELHRSKTNRETGEVSVVVYFLTFEDLQKMVPQPSATVEISL